MKIINIIHALLLFMLTSCFSLTYAAEKDCQAEKNNEFSHVISCYREKLAATPVNYTKLSEETSPGITIRQYQMTSQSWSPAHLVEPEVWQHLIDIYIPESPKSHHALLVVNNGINYPSGVKQKDEASDFSRETLTEIARMSQTIVISLRDVPNQYLHYKGDDKPLREDDSVARSWKLFMDAPQQRTLLPLHVPMSAATSQVIRVAKQELKAWHITKFIVSGASKRGWSAWLTFISDPDVEAVVPFVVDLVDTRVALTHMYHANGGNWPIAFFPYYQQGIDQLVNIPAFTSLMKIEDPMQYLSAGYITPMSQAKYIINASGDDFYAPDTARFYYDALPGEKALRVVPNSDHGGIRKVAEQTLIAFVNRMQNQKALPRVLTSQQGANLHLTFSEKPVAITRWTAVNATARDFRYACGINYTPSPVPVPATVSDPVTLALATEQPGWQATFVEATFEDGFVATSRVFITPDEVYPTTAPPVGGAACRTLPGRGLGGDTP